MTNDKGILIKNIYYMLSYAFQALKQTQYEKVAVEEFQNVQDLFAAILAKGVTKLVKQGLFRVYETRHDSLTVMRGKLELAETLRLRRQNKLRLACEFDELSEDNLFNQILKTAMYYLARMEGVADARQQDLRKLLPYFHSVDLLTPSSIAWSRLRYHRNNRNYELLLNVCFFVLHDLIQTTEAGERRVLGFSDQQMARLFEKFILEYYRYHHTYLDEVKSPCWDWAFGDDVPETTKGLFPKLRPDVLLRCGETSLILDAKYYGNIMAKRFATSTSSTFRSAHLYQMFAYVQNYARLRADARMCGATASLHDETVAGVLVYAATQETLPEPLVAGELLVAEIAGSEIGVLALDLNREFKEIAGQLDGVVERYFGNTCSCFALHRAIQ